MAFKGIFKAPKLVPAPFGLFSVAHVEDPRGSEWERHYSFEYDTEPTLDLIDATGVSVHSIASHADIDRWKDITPIQLQATDSRSVLGIVGEDRPERVHDQLEAATQKGVEEELADGYVTRADSTSNQYLADATTCTYSRIAPAAAISFVKAIASLESSISNSPVGEQGVLHMPRSVASLLGAQTGLTRIKDGNKEHLETMTGALVSVGSGYKGNGPIFEVSNMELTTNVATLTTSLPHYLSTGETVLVVGVDDPALDGTYTVASTPTPTTFTYAKTNANIASIAASGTIQMQGTQATVWVYATGAVDVKLGEILVMSDKSQGYGVTANTNDILFKALRTASVHFDPSIHYGVKVDLTV